MALFLLDSPITASTHKQQGVVEEQLGAYSLARQYFHRAAELFAEVEEGENNVDLLHVATEPFSSSSSSSSSASLLTNATEVGTDTYHHPMHRVLLTNIQRVEQNLLGVSN